jgi:mono/diheme cytochrome c family protein
MLASTFMAPASTEDNRDPLGKQVFEEACSSCHAWNGQGQQTPIAALRGRRSVYDPTGVNTIQTVLRGGAVDAPQGHAFMPAFARGYSNAEIAAVTNYVLAHFGAQTSHVLPKDVAKARQN